MKRSAVVVVVSLCVIAGMYATAFCGNRTDDPLGVAVSPQTLILNQEQSSVVVHTAIPLSAVDTSTVTLNGIPVVWTKADARGELVAFFDESAVKAIVTPPSAVLTLSGTMKDGSGFSGSDEVRVIVAA